MKQKFMLFLVMATLVTSSVSAASVGSVFGNLTTAPTHGFGNGNFTAALGIADATSVVTMLSYGLSTYSEGRIKLAVVDDEGIDPQIAFGADFRYHLYDAGGEDKFPFDLAVGGLVEWVDYGPSSIFQLGAMGIGSLPLTLANNSTLTPYGRLVVRLEKITTSFGGSSNSDSDIEFGLNGGVRFGLSESMSLYGEFQLDGNDGIFLGIDVNVL